MGPEIGLVAVSIDPRGFINAHHFLLDVEKLGLLFYQSPGPNLVSNRLENPKPIPPPTWRGYIFHRLLPYLEVLRGWLFPGELIGGPLWLLVPFLQVLPIKFFSWLSQYIGEGPFSLYLFSPVFSHCTLPWWIPASAIYHLLPILGGSHFQSLS